MPNRVLKESICYNEKIAALSWFEEVFFYHILVNCDDYGRLDARPEFLRSRCFCVKPRVTTGAVASGLDKLVQLELVTLYQVNGRSYLRVTGWQEHQNVKVKRERFPAPENGQTASDGHGCLNPIQSESESKSESKSESLSESDGGGDFDRFWKAYPVRIRKDRAREAYRTSVDVPVQVLLDAIAQQRRSVQWQKDDGQYIPYPANWLKNRGWEDDLPQSIPKGASGELGQAELEAIRRVLQED